MVIGRIIKGMGRARCFRAKETWSTKEISRMVRGTALENAIRLSQPG